MAQALRSVVTALGQAIPDKTPLIACAKGIERGTHKFMTEIIAECAPKATPAILSGPSFAADVARGLPTAVTIAATDATTADALAHAINSGTFRPYHSSDVRGVELGGATQNVLAIAAGIVTGRGLGASALAAMTTRGFKEVEAEALGNLIADVLDAHTDDKAIARVAGEVKKLCDKFPVYGA